MAAIVITTTISGTALLLGARNDPAPAAVGTVKTAGVSSEAAELSADVCRSARKGLRWYRGWHRHWLHKMGRDVVSKQAPIPGQPPGASRSCPRYLSKVFRTKAVAAREAYERWQKRQRHERLTYFRDLYEKWRCIHEHEGAWNSNTGNGYHGGLQMDYSFQSAYGPEFLRRWGLAHNWPVWAQLTAAERAYASRGFNPWPNTARMCGVL